MLSHTVSERAVSKGSVHLDALRGAAAMLVFINHTRALYFVSGSRDTTPRVVSSDTTTSTAAISTAAAGERRGSGGLKLASEAVIIFFVLSGYLVGGSVLRALRKDNWSWKDYMIRRLTRLWVPLIPCLLLCFVLDNVGYRVFGGGSIYRNPPGIDLITSWHINERLSLKIILGNLVFLQGILLPYFGTNNSLWSLANEFWYYIIFPCLALFATATRALWLRLLYLLLAIALLIFISRPVAVLLPIWLMGAVVAMLPHPLSSKQASLLSLLGLPLLLICMASMRRFHWSDLAAQYILAVVASAFLYLLIQQRDDAPRSIYRYVTSYFSHISYTLYIVHLPLAIFLASMINSPWRAWNKTPRNGALFVLLDLAVLGCATLLWRLFEANTDAIRKRLFERVHDAAPVSTIRLP